MSSPPTSGFRLSERRRKRPRPTPAAAAAAAPSPGDALLRAFRRPTSLVSTLVARERLGRNDFMSSYATKWPAQARSFVLDECFPEALRGRIVLLGFSRDGECLVGYQPGSFAVEQWYAGTPPRLRPRSDWRLSTLPLKHPEEEESDDDFGLWQRSEQRLQVLSSSDARLSVVVLSKKEETAGYPSPGAVTLAPGPALLSRYGTNCPFIAAGVRVSVPEDGDGEIGGEASVVDHFGICRCGEDRYVVAMNLLDSLHIITVSFRASRGARTSLAANGEEMLSPGPPTNPVNASAAALGASRAAVAVGTMFTSNPTAHPATSAVANAAAAGEAAFDANASPESEQAERNRVLKSNPSWWNSLEPLEFVSCRGQFGAVARGSKAAAALAVVETVTEEKSLDIEALLLKLWSDNAGDSGIPEGANVRDYDMRVVGTCDGGRSLAITLALRSEPFTDRAGGDHKWRQQRQQQPGALWCRDVGFLLKVDVSRGDVTILERVCLNGLAPSPRLFNSPVTLQSVGALYWAGVKEKERFGSMVRPVAATEARQVKRRVLEAGPASPGPRLAPVNCGGGTGRIGLDGMAPAEQSIGVKACGLTNDAVRRAEGLRFLQNPAYPMIQIRQSYSR